MEQVIQVHSKGNKSLRAQILMDEKGLKAYKLLVRKEKQSQSTKRWAEIISEEGYNGVVKFRRDETTNILTFRLENSKPGTPYPLMGIFINYLMEKHKAKIKFLVVVPE